MTIPRPTASLLLEGSGAPGVGGGPLDAAQAAVRRLVVDLSVDDAHDRVELVLWRDSRVASAEPGARLTVGLGDGDDVEDVLTVEVAGADATGWGTVVTGYAPSRRLSSTFVGRSYVDQTVGDVVTDLLESGDVEQGTVDSSLKLPVLHVDPRRSVWATLHALSRRTGCQVTTDADGAVSFTPLPGATAGGGLAAAATAVAGALGLTGSGELREGAELLAFRSGPRGPSPAVRVQSPVAARGGLLLASPDSGSGAPVDVDPAARTPEAAETATKAREAAARRRTRVASVVVSGRPGLRAGGTVKARGADYRILRARHVLDADAGYVCDLLLEGDQ
jgi:phage protein D